MTNTVEGAVIKVKALKLDPVTGIAAGLSITQEDLNIALANAKADSNGIKTIRVEVPVMAGGSGYTIELPAAALRSDAANVRIEVVTGFGTIQVPSVMLDKAAQDAKRVELTIGTSGTTKLDPVTQSMAGSRPAISLGVKIDGTAEAENSLNAPVEVRIPYLPSLHELVTSEYLTVWHVNADGKPVQIRHAKYDAVKKALVFNTTQPGTYAVAYTHKSFSDVAPNAWYQPAVETMASKGFIDGTSSTDFSPDSTVTRIEYLAWLVRTLGLSAEFAANFSDIHATNQYYEEIGIARALGITVGFDGNFNPGAEITRQDIAVMTMRALRAADPALQTGTSGDLKEFTDSGQVAAYAAEDLAAMVELGLMNGQGNAALNPKGATTRAQAAQVLYKIYQQQQLQ
ncbi:hypothetical protein AWJ19_23535 [Paenibacillus sp. DMB5]|nr:hypothetical protein AWJ19_23535 [Paenibacillus sp. DMB5]